MVGVWGFWGPECFGVSQFPRGPAGKLGQEEVVEKKKFSKETFPIENVPVRSFGSAAALERSEAARRRAKAPRARGVRD